MNAYPAQVLLVAAALVAAGCGQSGGKPKSTPSSATVVVAIPKEGPEAHLGRDIERAARMQFEARGESPALKRLRLVVVDEATPEAPNIDPEKVAQRTQDQIDTGTVIGWVGGVDSDALAVELPRLNEAGVAAVSPSATATPFNRRDPAFPGAPIKYYPAFARYGLSFARTSPTDLSIAPKCLTALASKRVKKVFTVDSGDTDGDSFSSAVETASLRSKVSVVGHESVPQGHADWEGLVQQIEAAGAQAVIWGSAPNSGEHDLWAAVAKSKLRVQMVAGSVTPPSTLSKFPHVGRGTVICSAALPAGTADSGTNSFAAAFTSKWGHEPAPGSLRGAAAMGLIIEAIKQANPTHKELANPSSFRADVTRQLGRIRTFDSLFGRIRLDHLGNWSAAPVGMWVLKGDTPVFSRLP